MIHRRDVIFDELTMGTEENELIKDVQPVQIETNGDNGDQEEENGEANNEELPPHRCSERIRKRPDYYGEWTHVSVQRTEPTTIDEVLSSPDKLWEEAMQKEMNLLKRMMSGT